jgi:predicted MFS family arabinose efflux permease
LVQVPPTLAALAMVALALKVPTVKTTDKTQSNWDRVKRIDFTGALFLGTTILSLCLILDLGGTRLPWASHWIFVLLGTTFASGVVFIISAKRAAEPIFPLELATHFVVVTNYVVILLQTTAQSALMVTVPIYFQVTAAASTSEAGAHLIPAFAGNTLGGLITGYCIKRTGRYKPLTILSPIMGVLCTLTLLFVWDGHTSPWLSLLIFPGGLAMGIISSSAFVGLAAGVEEEAIAVTTSGMFLAFNIGSIAGVSSGSAVLQNVLRSSLGTALGGVDGGEEVQMLFPSLFRYDADNIRRS